MTHLGYRSRHLSDQAQKLVFTAFLRSHIMYQFTSLLATGLTSKDDINKFELYMKRKHIGAPNDIKSQVIDNLTNWHKKKISNICEA